MTLVIIAGIPGSGKSTLAKKICNLNPGTVHLEADMFFHKDGEYKFDRELLPQAHAWCRHACEHGLKNGRNVVVSNTFTKAWERAPYFALAKKYGAKVKVIVANGNYQNVHGVPVDIVNRMKSQFEKIELKEYA